MPDESTRILLALEVAAGAKRRAESEYRAALVGAVDALTVAGVYNPYAVLSRELGVSRQAVRQAVGLYRTAGE